MPRETSIFDTTTFDHSYSLSLGGADEAFFADLPDADTSFSGSWSGEDENIIEIPFVPFEQPSHMQSATIVSPAEVFALPSQVVELQSVTVSTPAFEHPVANGASEDDDEATGEADEDAEEGDEAEAEEGDGEHEETMQTSSGRRVRKRSRKSYVFDDEAGDSDDEDEFAPKSRGPARKARRTGTMSRPGAVNATRTAARLAAIKSKTTRAAQSKLKRKSGVTLTKGELELAGTLDLSRDELLNMTSDSLEAYANKLATERPLTTEEQKRFKRQRRLIKNRESAQLSRLRKKAYVDELEKQIAELEDEKERVKKRCDDAERDADLLRQEVARLQQLVAQHPALAELAVPPHMRRQKLVA